MDTVWYSAAANIEKVTNVLTSEIDLVVLPEMFNTGFGMTPADTAEPMDGYTIRSLKELSVKFDTAIIGSLAIMEDGKYYNRAVMIDRGQLIDTYDKRYLFSLSGEDEAFQAGEKAHAIHWNGINLHIQICYDLRFPEFTRQIDGIDLIINVANWPEPRIPHWNKLLVARAIENQCYVIGCNRTGVDGNEWTFNGSSAVIDPGGEVLLNAGSQERFITLPIDIELARTIKKKYPFQDDKL